jgi:peptidoglycan/LPS O-acetylase OafA/YrhL
VTTGLSFFCKAILAERIVHQYPDVENLIETCAQMWLFASGAIMAKNWRKISIHIVSLSVVSAILALTAAAFLVVNQWIVPLPSIVTYVVTGIGAMCAISLVGAVPFIAGWFKSRPLQVAGRISYSLYAIHFPLIAATVLLLARWRGGLGVSILAGVTAAVFGAYLLHRYIENPMIAVGRKAGRVKAFMTLRPAE